MSNIEYTGERFVPGQSPSDLASEHYARYKFALKYVKDRTVLDIGCGEGYGSRMLSAAAESVTGVDIDSESIEHANKMYAAENLKYLVADARSLPFEAESFDACVCFEVIEHIDFPDMLLSEVARVLKPNGVFLVSTPNGAVKISSQPNPFHVKEYTLDEFSQMICKYFPKDLWKKSIHGQFVVGKQYSSFKMILKNIYLMLKGKLGMKPVQKQPDCYSRALIEYEFREYNAHLAEYLLAVVSSKGQY